MQSDYFRVPVFSIKTMLVGPVLHRESVCEAVLKHSEQWQYAQDVKFPQIKTVAATVDDACYAQTREFYSQRGYAPIEIFPTLWSPHSPVLQLIKVITAV